jgi:hypothetical protein
MTTTTVPLLHVPVTGSHTLRHYTALSFFFNAANRRVVALALFAVAITATPAYSGHLHFAWDPSPDPSVSGYVLYYGTSPGAYTNSIDVGNVTNRDVPGLSAGVRYYFVVRGYAGATFSTPSNEVSGVALNQPPTVVNPGNRTVQQGSFSLGIVASDADGDPLTYTATGLPAGVTMNASSGVISGNVTPGSSTITVTVSDGPAQASTTFTLTVTASNNAPTLTAPGNQTNDTDDAVALQLSASDPDGDPLTFSATGLPPGLTLNTSSGLISGTPTTPGTYSVTATVNDGTTSTSRTFTWSITAVTSSSGLIGHWPFDENFGSATSDVVGGRTATLTNGAQWTSGHTGAAVALDGTNDFLGLSPFDVVGSGITISAWVKNSSLPGGVDQRFVSKANGTAEGDHYWMLGTWWEGGTRSRLRFRLRTGTVTSTLIATSSELVPNVWYHAAATYDGATMRLYLNGVQVASMNKTGSVATGASVPVTFGRNPEGSGFTQMFGALDDVRIYDRGLTAAEVSALVSGGGGANQPPTVVNPGDRTVQQGPFSLGIAASDADGDPLTYTATGLPAGLTLNASTGVISGNVTPGSSTITVTVSDGPAQASTTFTLTVTASNSGPTLAAPGNQTNDTDDAVALQLSASDPDGDPLTFSATGLPPGLTLNTSSGLISGTPTTPGTYSVTATVNDGTTSTSRTFSWSISTVPTSSGLVGHWPFDENFGSATSDVVGGRTATLTNGAQWTSGHAGAAVALDGINDFLGLSPFDVVGSGITIAAWVKSSSLPGGVDQRFVSKATGPAEGDHYWMLGTWWEGGSRSLLRFRLRTGSVTSTLIASSGDLVPNMWYHAAATYDGTTMRLYLNGVLVGSMNKTGSVATGASVPVTFGRNPEGSGFTQMHGVLDDVRIYDRGLTAAEIGALAGGN